MSFNGTGTFILNTGGYPYQPNTLIVSANVNALLNDIANGLSLTVTRDGQMSMTGPLHMANQLIDGIKNLQFGSATTSPGGAQNGFYLTAANTIGVGINGSVVGSFTSTGLNGIAIGATTTSTGAFTTLSASGAFTVAGITNTGSDTATAFIPTGAIVPANGMYLSAANTLAFATNTTFAGEFSSLGNFLIGTSTDAGAGFPLQVFGSTNAPQLVRNWVNSTGASAQAIFRCQTGTANSIFSMGLTDNGAPVALLDVGAGVASFGISVSGAAAININTATKGVQVNAPSSGTALHIGSAANAIAADVNWDGAGTYYEVGSRDIPFNTQASTYTLLVTDRGKVINETGHANVTVPNAVFSQGNVVSVLNNSATAMTLVQGASMSMIQEGTGATGNRTIAGNGLATILFTGASQCYVGGPGVS
jgi:hypothetical protein